MRILQFLGSEAMTVTHTARRFGVHPANLTHHFRKLQEAGLISLVEERDTGRVVEKYYRAIAGRFEIRSDNLSLDGAGHRALLLLIDDMQSAISALPRDATDVVCLLSNVKITGRTFERFHRKLKRLTEEFQREAKSDSDESDSFYSLNLSLYPRRPDSFSEELRSDSEDEDTAAQ